jgi:mono/diheme cytochrome c family protein
LTDINECDGQAANMHAGATITEVRFMTLRIASAFTLAWFSVCGVVVGSARAQDAATNDVQEGHRLATLICSACHVAARDQPFEPILRPPAPTFESIAQRSSITADSVRMFLSTTHRDISSPNGMPNPQLLDYQINQITAYLLSLRKRP